MSITEQSYVLGTHDEEIDRLGLQHRVWRAKVLECWQRAGITIGSNVIDLGAGPGFATVDLAEIVGSTGSVLALERSERFVRYGKAQCEIRGFNHVHYRQADLMLDPIQERGYDATWCRWVAAFVSSPEQLVATIAQALNPGGKAIFHEYIDYKTYRLAPRRQGVESFVDTVIANWRKSGGEPNIALELPRMLVNAGFTIRYTQPLIFAVTPDTMMWQWPASFIKTHLEFLLQTKQADTTWVDSVRQELQEAEADPVSLMITPTVLEIVAEKKK